MGIIEVVMGLGAAKPQKAVPEMVPPTRFDQLLDAINRLPRPLMAMGTLALFADAMLDPVGFANRMAALRAMPDPLWWLVGGIITFYFGARETHYLRHGVQGAQGVVPGTEGPDTRS